MIRKAYIPTKYRPSTEEINSTDLTHQAPTKHPLSKNEAIVNLVKALDGEMSSKEIQELLGLISGKISAKRRK